MPRRNRRDSSHSTTSRRGSRGRRSSNLFLREPSSNPETENNQTQDMAAVGNDSREGGTGVAEEGFTFMGRVVQGVIYGGNATMGYLVTLEIPGTDKILKGLVMDTSMMVPVTPENDIAPRVQMIPRDESIFQSIFGSSSAATAAIQEEEEEDPPAGVGAAFSLGIQSRQPHIVFGQNQQNDIVSSYMYGALTSGQTTAVNTNQTAAWLQDTPPRFIDSGEQFHVHGGFSHMNPGIQVNSSTQSSFQGSGAHRTPLPVPQFSNGFNSQPGNMLGKAPSLVPVGTSGFSASSLILPAMHGKPVMQFSSLQLQQNASLQGNVPTQTAVPLGSREYYSAETSETNLFSAHGTRQQSLSHMPSYIAQEIQGKQDMLHPNANVPRSNYFQVENQMPRSTWAPSSYARQQAQINNATTGGSNDGYQQQMQMPSAARSNFAYERNATEEFQRDLAN